MSSKLHLQTSVLETSLALRLLCQQMAALCWLVAVGAMTWVPMQELPAASMARLNELVAVNPTGFATTKLQVRHYAAEALRKHQSEDLDTFIRSVQKEEVQATLGAYLAALSKPK